MSDTEVASMSSVDVPMPGGEAAQVSTLDDNLVPGEAGAPSDGGAGLEPTQPDEAANPPEATDKGRVEKEYSQLTLREKTINSLDIARKLIEFKLADATLPEALQESAKVALSYGGKQDRENTQALQALGEVLAAINTPEAIALLKNISEHQRFATKSEWDAGISYTPDDWMAKRDEFTGDDLKGFDERAIIGYEFPPEAEVVPVQPEDLLIQEGIAALLARRDSGEALTPDQEGQLKLLELAASAKGEGGLLLKIQLLKKIGLETEGDTELAGRLEIAQAKLDSLLKLARVEPEDLKLLSDLSSSDVPAFMAKALTLSVGGLDNFIFGEKMSIEDMQKMLHSLPLSEEKKDALDKMPLGLPIGLGILFALLSAGLVVGKASMKEMRK